MIENKWNVKVVEFLNSVETKYHYKNTWYNQIQAWWKDGSASYVDLTAHEIGIRLTELKEEYQERIDKIENFLNNDFRG